MKTMGTTLALLALLFFTGCRRAAAPPEVAPGALDPSLASLIATSRQAVLDAPKFPETWGRLGMAFHAAEFLPEAKVCYRRAEHLDPQSPRWAHLLGVLERADDPGLAFQYLQRAVMLGGDQTEASRHRLALFAEERGNLQMAETHLRDILARNSNAPAARLALGRVLLAREKLDDASDTLAPLTNTATTPTREAMLLLAQVRQRQGATDDATRLARQASALPSAGDAPDPYLDEVISLRGDARKRADQANALLVEGKIAEAGPAIEELLRNFPNDSEGLLLLGRLRLQQKRCAEAEEILKRHLASQPQSLNGLMQLAFARFCQQRWDDAAAALKQAIALKPDSAQAHYNLGFTLLRTGDSAGGIAALREAVRCSPGDANSRLALADALRRAGDAAGARQQLERVLEASPNHPQARQMLDRLRP